MQTKFKTKIVCPKCGSKRLTKILHGLSSPRPAFYCRKCKKIHFIQIMETELYTCTKCLRPIIADSSDIILLANNKTKHRRCKKPARKEQSDTKG